MLLFIVIYLHNVRGISFAEAGLALAFGGVAALGTGWVAGSTVDRIGGATRFCSDRCCRPWPSRSSADPEPWHAFALLALEGAGTACSWPGQSTLLARLTPPATGTRPTRSSGSA